MAPRKQQLVLLISVCMITLIGLTYLVSAPGRTPYATSQAPSRPQYAAPEQHSEKEAGSANSATSFADGLDLGSGVFTGAAIAPKLGNATAKAELGRATWKFLHTMMARFPDEPTPDDSLALKTFMTLFARLYPCGECAGHFQKLLAKYPVQTSSRNAAAGWACFAHNQVNERLKKPIFDCNNIGDFYDCGCAEDKGKKKVEGGGREGGGAASGSGTAAKAHGEYDEGELRQREGSSAVDSRAEEVASKVKA